MATYFKNLTELHTLYVSNTYVKFNVNHMLFTIQSVILFFIHNFRLRKLKI